MYPEEQDSPKPLKIADLDASLRPQEKALEYGVESLSTSELLALILRAGQPGHPITEITAGLLDNAGGSLHFLGRKSMTELQLTPGMGVVKSLQVASIMELAKRYYVEGLNDKSLQIKQASDIDRYMRPKIGSLPQEEIWLITLRRNNEIICRHMITRGSAVASVFDLKRCLKLALLDEAAGIILCHNHPSSNLQPSPQDDQITRQLAEAARTMDLNMLDHIIVTHRGFFSYRDEGRLR